MVNTWNRIEWSDEGVESRQGPWVERSSTTWGDDEVPLHVYRLHFTRPHWCYCKALAHKVRRSYNRLTWRNDVQVPLQMSNFHIFERPLMAVKGLNRLDPSRASSKQVHNPTSLSHVRIKITLNKCSYKESSINIESYAHRLCRKHIDFIHLSATD